MLGTTIGDLNYNLSYLAKWVQAARHCWPRKTYIMQPKARS